MSAFKKINFKTVKSRRYNLTPIEHNEHIPFTVKRTYFLSAFEPGAVTSEHCHKVEEEVFVVASGSITAIIDDGSGKHDVLLKTGEGIYVPKLVWHGFKNPSADALIVAFSSTNYSADRSDYIESYDEFMAVTK